jgi:hypothetical protein
VSEALKPVQDRYDEMAEQRGGLLFERNLHRFPIPRLRWTWDGPKYAALTLELSEKYSDAVLGVTWELPSRLSTRIDAALRKIGK